jgi:uncharacterized membrane protein
MKKLKNYFLTGLATLLPLAVTVAVLRIIVNFLTNPFLGAVSHLLGPLPIPPELIHFISQVLILVALFLFLLLIGMFGRWFFVHSFLKIGDQILHKIPLVNKVYKTSKDIVVSLFGQDAKSFQEVVMAAFPNEHCYVIGLIARNAPQTCTEAMQQEMASVFIPTTPNPTTGFLIMRPRSELIYLDMSPEDALKYIVSCGVAAPEARN